MTDQAHSYPRLQLLIDALVGWLKRRRELSEIGQLDREAVERIAGDLRISPGDLDELIRSGPHAAAELPRMLKALGIDEAVLARTEPLVLREMERVCALCKDKARCRDDLAVGTADQHYEEYCLNAPTIDSLGEDIVKHA
jgi:transcriptional regulator with XRE-family HTH domain